MSSTIDIPCGVFLDVPAENDGSRAASAVPPQTYQRDGDDRRGSGDRRGSDTNVSEAGSGLQDRSSHAGHDGRSGQKGESGAVEDDEGYPDNIEDFMATLLDGMRSDSVQLATSARNVVANTYQVGVVEWFFRCFICACAVCSVAKREIRDTAARTGRRLLAHNSGTTQPRRTGNP